MQRLTYKLQNFRTAEKRLVDLLLDMFVPVVFHKGAILVTPIYSTPVLYFIEEGLVRGYFDSDGEQQTSWIMESGFLLPTKGIFSSNPGIEYISFLKDSRCYALNLFSVEELAVKEPRIYRMLLEIYEEGLREGKQRELLLRIKNAGERFLYFKSQHPRLIYLPIHDILASVLNIESKYLYRIKKIYR